MSSGLNTYSKDFNCDELFAHVQWKVTLRMTLRILERWRVYSPFFSKPDSLNNSWLDVIIKKSLSKNTFSFWNGVFYELFTYDRRLEDDYTDIVWRLIGFPIIVQVKKLFFIQSRNGAAKNATTRHRCLRSTPGSQEVMTTLLHPVSPLLSSM